jgi:hypothetical protein
MCTSDSPAPERRSKETLRLMGMGSYVINTKAQKEMYKTSPRNINVLNEPKDLSREWHSDGVYPTIQLI